MGALVAAGVLLAACKSTELDARPPALRVAPQVVHWVGSPIAGPAGEALEPGKSEDAWSVTIDVLALSRWPEGVLDAIGKHTRAVLRPAQASVVVPTVEYLAGTRIGDVQGAEDFVQRVLPDPSTATAVAQRRAASPARVTVMVDIEQLAANPTDPPRNRLSLLLHRGETGDEVQIALAVRTPTPEEVGEELSPEIAILDRLGLDRLDSSGAGSKAIVIPLPAPDGGQGAVAFVVTVRAAPPPGAADFPEHQRAYAECLADVARVRASIEVLEERRPPAVPLPTVWEVLRRGAEGAGGKWEFGYALALASQARLTEDMLLVCDDELLTRILGAITTEVTKVASAEDIERLRWAMERTTLQAMLERAMAGDEDPTLLAILTHHTGAVGLRVGTLEEALELASNSDHLQALLLELNSSLLRDGSAAVRARAAAWLQEREAIPPGYDPLAPVSDREFVPIEETAPGEVER
ncbi:MAG: hypothetical protein AB1486_04795 [Planctomycetota bacterium]